MRRVGPTVAVVALTLLADCEVPPLAPDTGCNDVDVRNDDTTSHRVPLTVVRVTRDGSVAGDVVVRGTAEPGLRTH
jgi:hypothetical protein